MMRLKTALVTTPALKPIVYTPDASGSLGRILLGVDASKLGYGAILQQEDENGKRHPSRYESGLWTAAETRYDAVKLECHGLLRALKKFRYYVYGVHFLVKIDAKTLVHQLNQPATDLPGAVVGRLLAYIRLFSFDIQHVSGTRHRGPDALSRRPPSEEEWKCHAENGGRESQELEERIDGELGYLKARDEAAGVELVERAGCQGFCTSSLHAFSFVVLPLSFPSSQGLDSDSSSTSDFIVSFVSFQRGLYDEEPGLVRIGDFLSTLRRPVGMGVRNSRGSRGRRRGFY
jgi:hypothetical protein